MNPFLKTLAHYTLHTYGEKKLENLTFVFPNRRSCLFFKNYLMEAGKGPYWLPEILTINDFVSGFSSLETADPIDVSFELYRIYKKLAANPEGYDEFYFWGEMLISDFDDLDKYLVPAEKLFTNIVNLKEIEQVFGGFSEEQLEVIREFWAHFGQAGLSSEKKSFLEMWKLLFPIYRELNDKLREAGIGYEGMLNREVAGSFSSSEFRGITQEKVIIAGFNALNNAEREIFRYLKKNGKGLFFWDYDEMYVSNSIPEAGRFLRKNLEEFPPVDMGETFDHLKKEKKISIIDLPSDLLQSKQLGKILGSDLNSGYESFDDTAVILADETLLEPVLTSLPAHIPYVNITMGYPLAHTPVYSFTDQLLKLQKNIAKQPINREERFYYRDVLDVLNHQYLRYIIDKDTRDLIASIHARNMIYITPGFFSVNPLLVKIFRKIERVVDLPSYLREILEEVMGFLIRNDEEKSGFSLEREYTFHIITRLNKLETIFRNDPPDAGIETFYRFFKKIISHSRIPFQGEPLRGLQVMGILESRLLDFKNIVFLSMNEGTMPRAHTAFSFIPAGLRHAFGMPGREDHDAIYAYYFYRLIQRAENVSILYNSKTDGLHSGEKSRYLYQLEFLGQHKPEIKTVSFHISNKEAVPILIEKTPEAIAILEEFTHAGRRAFSPTALNTWIDCRLKFYFTYIAGIREEDEASEEIDAPVLGNLLHETMRLIYGKHIGVPMDSNQMKELSDKHHIDKCLREAFRIRYSKTASTEPFTAPEGKNIIVYEVIKKLVSQILIKDAERIPFTVLDLEKKYECMLQAENRDVRIYGIIDRVDIKGNSIYIIDYKTGKTEMSFNNVIELFDPETKKRNKHVLQTLIYSYLYSHAYEGENPIIPCLYATRNIFNDDFNPVICIKTSPKLKEEITGFHKLKAVVEENLKLVVTEIFSRDIPFSQTSDVERCKFCPFIEICHREENGI